MTINFLAIIVVTIATFIAGALWFGPIFGKVWMKIHHADKLSKEEMAKSMKGMWKLMTAEFVLTFVMNFFLYFIVTLIKGVYLSLGTSVGYDPAGPLLAILVTTFFIWLGFVLPAITSSVLWGNDDRKVMFKKIAISSVYRLFALLAAAYIFFIWN